MRKLATASLKEFGILDPKFWLVRQAGNTLYRVHSLSTSKLDDSDDIYVKDHYLLRIHEPGYQEPEAIEFELAWLTAMRREANLPVPEPMTTLDGQLLVAQEIPGTPLTRHCSLLRWVKGRSVKNKFRPFHLQAQGRLMGQLHNFASEWQALKGVNKRKFDWEGLFQNDVGSGMPNADAWALLTPPHREAFSIVAERVKEIMDEWGENPDIFGLIHGDLGVDANLLFWHGEPRAIDFDDSGFGYYIFDLAVALDAVRDHPDYTDYKGALLKGYREFRQLPEEQAQQTDLFLAALEVYWNLWATGGTHLYPELLDEYKERIASTADFVIRYVRQSGGIK
jgi:Ser/Thr protein kinase RdoA (MazF antagonist)